MKGDLIPVPLEIHGLHRDGANGEGVIADVFDVEARLLMSEGSRAVIRLPGTNWRIGEIFQIVIEKLQK